MLSLYLLLLVGAVAGSHYRGGTMSYIIRANAGNPTTTNGDIAVQITQRHSWRRSAWFCNDTDPSSGDMIGEGALEINSNRSFDLSRFPQIDTMVRCTDYSKEFDYSSGENSSMVFLPPNKRIEYIYKGCCWISLLPPDSDSNWSLKFLINTNRRADGTWNNSPKTTMSPIVQVQVGRVHVIRIPMGDSDGDTIRCRWGNSAEECGSICARKGPLSSNPCELTYNATRTGYHAVALVIEDFDSNNTLLSAIPLQFLIHIVNITTKINCTAPRIFIAEWSQDSCIGIESNTTFKTRVQVNVSCEDKSISLKDILTISPTGFIRGNIVRDVLNPSIYTMPVEWTPQSHQYGIHQLCFTPMDSEQRTSSQMCLTFQVDVRPPKLVRVAPIGLVSATQSSWIIQTDRDIVKPKRSSGIYVRFFKRSNNEEVHRIDVVTDTNVVYRRREINFYTTGHTWEQGEEYYILLDSGIAILNESCGVESVATNNSNTWVFRVAATQTTASNEITSSKEIVTNSPEQFSSARPTISSPSAACPRWFQFNRISNESTSATEPYFTFCFSVETALADVTIAANTWISCMKWKLSGAADPLLELYREPADALLAQNDDANSHAFQNCYAAVLSYRLERGDYRVIIRNPKCSYGKFELRLSAEIDQNIK